MVTGDKGAGKTTLLRHMKKGGGWRSCAVLVQSGQSSKNTGPVRRRSGLMTHLDKDGRERILAMDDTHLLKDNELLYLVQQSLASQTMYRIRRVVLLGEPGLSSRVRRLTAQAGWEVDYSEIKIPRMDRTETGDYLRRLWAAREKDAPFPFSERQMDRLFTQSGGVMGEAAARAALLYADKTGRSGLWGLVQTPRGRAAALVATLLVLTAAVWLPPMAGGLFSEKQENAPQARPADTEAQKPPNGERVRGPDWIRKQDPNAWTIEVVRLFNPASIRQFQRIYGLNPPVASYPAKPDGVHVVLAGVFPDRAGALAAVKSLSEKLTGYKLMVRSFGQIRPELP